MQTEIYNIKSFRFELVKIEQVENLWVFNKFLNWVIGEFDLYLKTESEILKVYFPNGCFTIRKLRDEYNKEILEVKVGAKSEKGCQKIMDQLKGIYNHVMCFT